MGFPTLWRKWIKECVGTTTTSVLVNIRAMRAVLVLFENLSGLKVNFSKSQLVGVNVSTSWLTEAAMVLSCKMGTVPFVYLGLPIGGNARRLAFWEPLLHRINSRLSSWNSKYLSFGGRLVLLKYVLSSLPVYALSFFKAPAGIISSIESILNCFFSGGRGGVRTTGKFLGWIGILFAGVRRLEVWG